ncbi:MULTISPECIES: carbohydrate ABC transporter permease [unclassified Oceanispirochaeta]|uniref:carbohydrate ABC transporter permease n=1 Tax=unclassified Oceanispirochaeta TaxID=2635722 RepID=UPI000E09A036|nr:MULTISPECIES: carbohydrate ABC transporter permease [unclassified Oceanispirochaeta]MBF9017581.1 carbohydrate ABC transporter permease [Oceanispirochaeta sp. M2]NPD74153.1 carbohydrate ABC transporter permease [Oceanispirochaeta sp. M1]RDG30072.1 carbohydrate ABC transporter permease [Oceanispirochaeta sp. M1]
MVKIKKDNILPTVFSILWSVLTLYPFITTLFSSLKNNDEIFGNMFAPPTVFRYQNYIDAITGARMDRAIFNSLFVTSITTVMLVAVGSMAAYTLARFRYKILNYIYVLFILGIMLPIHSTLIPLAKTVSTTPWLGSNSFFTLMLIYTAFQLPVTIFIITGFMRGISRELDEAATIDGCGPVRILFQIILPLAKPGIATAAIISYLFVYNELIFAVIFLSKPVKFTISLAMLYFVGDRTMRMGPIFASIILAVLPMICIYLIFSERVQKGMTAGAIKG